MITDGYYKLKPVSKKNSCKLAILHKNKKKCILINYDAWDRIFISSSEITCDDCYDYVYAWSDSIGAKNPDFNYIYITKTDFEHSLTVALNKIKNGSISKY